MDKYSTSDLRNGGQLLAMRIIFAFPERKFFTAALYPKVAFPDFITSFRRAFMESDVFFYIGHLYKSKYVP
jgi:hypothetical protein